MRIPWHEFLSTTGEWHSFAIGLCEVLCPWPPRVKCPLAKPEILAEYHYYLFGRAVGVIVWVVIGVGIAYVL